MSKTSLRQQIDLEMKDVQLSPELVRRIHSQTDRKSSRKRSRRRVRLARTRRLVISPRLPATLKLLLLKPPLVLTSHTVRLPLAEPNQ